MEPHAILDIFVWLLSLSIEVFPFLIELQLIQNVSGVQQSDFVYRNIYILMCYICYMYNIHSSQIIFHYRLLQDIAYSSLYYTVGPC